MGNGRPGGEMRMEKIPSFDFGQLKSTKIHAELPKDIGKNWERQIVDAEGENLLYVSVDFMYVGFLVSLYSTAEKGAALVLPHALVR